MKIKDAGWGPIPGFQLYIYFLNPAARQRLTVPILPFSKIDEMGRARMYKGVSYARTKQANWGDQLETRRCDSDLYAPKIP